MIAVGDKFGDTAEKARRLYGREMQRLRERERLKMAAAEIIEVLRKHGAVSQPELCRRAGKSPNYIYLSLHGSKNMTLRSLSDLAFAMGFRVELETTPIEGWEDLQCQTSCHHSV